ncbi:MAG: ribonuclease HII [Verrucomicrobia bacterium]|nr:ribonuclease HII [Verrucomicrobiota bacterium]
MGSKATPVDRFSFERTLLAKGIWPVAGVDEAGRGPLAGPVLAAAVILPDVFVRDGMPPDLTGLNDSKQLSAEQREAFFLRLTTDPAIRFGLGRIDPPQIDAINILQATHAAMNLALAALSQSPQPPAHVLVDGLHVRSIRMSQTAIVKGDSLSYSIAAASILAKVTRDRLMQEFDAQFPGYGFARHKGYGTSEHLGAIRCLGPCPIHRRSFSPFRPVELELFPPPL